SALTACSSCTRFMSIRTCGATMPRRMFTTRSVPPPSGMLLGLAARAAITSSSVFGLSTRKSGRASIRQVPRSFRLVYGECGWHSQMTSPATIRFRGLFLRALALFDRLKNAIRRHRQIVEPDPDRVGDGVGQRRQERRKRALARFLGAEGPVRIVAFDNPNLDGRRILDCRHAIIEHVGGDHQAFVIGGLFTHGLAHAHPD